MTAMTQTFPPAPAGMNTAKSGQEIDDTEAQYLQDILLDKPGLARRRGPVQRYTSFALLPRPATGLAITMDPTGTDRYAALTGNVSNGYLTVWSADKTSTVDLAWPHALPTDPAGSAATAYRLHSAMPALGGGTWIGTASNYGTSDSLQALARWQGGTKADYTTGTITLTRGSAIVTGSGTSWLANVVPGMFLFANTDDAGAGSFTDTLIGVVLTVDSNTQLKLVKRSPYSGSAGRSYTLRSIRGFIPRVAKGKVTAATDSTTLTGGGTKFAAQGLGSGTWNIYRSSDFTWIGKVASVQSDLSLTLAANAAIAVAEEPYVAIRGDWSADDKSIDIGLSTSKTGWLTGIYAERQWYLNNSAMFEKTYRLWFSEPNDPEAVDLSEDGDWIPVVATTDMPEPGRALVPTYNALLILKESESFAVYGSSPSNFSARKLEDDGTLSTMTVQSFGGGALWAGRHGVYYYDGVQVKNITDAKLGHVWKNSIRSVVPERYRLWSMVVRNHYALFIESIDPTVAVIKGNTAATPDHWVVFANMQETEPAITLATNVGLRGAVTLPSTAGRGVLYVVNNDTTGYGTVCNADDLFDAEGVDEFIATDGGALGPDFYWNSKKYNAGNDVQLKRFKQLALHYLAQGGNVNVDVVLGLNEVGQTLGGNFPATVLSWDALRVLLPNWNTVADEYSVWDTLVEGVFRPKRVRFLKKDHHMSFRLWQSASTMQRVQIGPFAIAFKLMRPTRVS